MIYGFVINNYNIWIPLCLKQIKLSTVNIYVHQNLVKKIHSRRSIGKCLWGRVSTTLISMLCTFLNV